MRIGPAAHGVLLGVALIVAYQGWTREETEDLNVGDYIVWQAEDGAVEAVIYDSERKSVRIEQRKDDAGAYLWGTVKRSRPNPKAAHPELDTGAEDEAAEGSEGEGESEAAAEPAMITTTTQFPVGEAGEGVVKNFATLHALRDLGVLDEETKQKYELHESKDNLTVLFEGGKQRILVVGKRVYGGSDRYVLDPETGKAYVISTEIMRPIEGAENALDLEDLHDFEDDAVQRVEVKTAKGAKRMVKSEIEDENGPQTVWAYAETPKEADLTVANFLDRASRLRPSEYDPELKPEDLVHLATFRFGGADGKELGYLELYRQTPEMQDEEEEEETDPLGRPAPRVKRTQYWLRTEKTRVLGKASPVAAERVDNDLVELFGIEPPPPAPEPAPGMPGPHGAGPHGADPHGADPHGAGAHGAAPHGAAANPHGGPADAHGHGAPAAPPANGKPDAEKPAAKKRASDEAAATKPAAKQPAKKPAAPKPAAQPATPTP